MIKIIQDNKVIDVVKYPKYVKFLSPKRIAMTNKALAQGVVGSDGTKIYSYAPVESKTAGVVTVAEICQEEYDRLSDLLYATETVSADEVSLAKAKEAISLTEFEESMKGIYTTSVTQSTIDESPMVYKPMQEIIDNISDTVDIIDIIKPVYNFKASDA